MCDIFLAKGQTEAMWYQVFKIKRIMAKPIAPTRPLTGQAAVDFFAEMEQQKQIHS